MKRIVAAITSIICVMGCMAFVPCAGDADFSAVSVTASAADAELVEPGINAGSYTNPYADTLCYTYTITAVKPNVSAKDQTVKDAAIALVGANGKGYEEAGGGAERKYFEEYGLKLGLYTVTIKRGKEVVATEYHVGLAGVKDTILDLKMQDFTIPDEFAAYVNVAYEDAKLADTKHISMIADSAFVSKTKSYLKTIDMTGIQYIGKSAFKDCGFITEITIPATVKYVGDGAFEGSGLKTLAVKNDMPVIPNSFCAKTNLTEVSFAHPEQIRKIGSKAFTGTPLSAPIFNTWGDAKGYETLEIFDSAFEGCTSITEVNMPANLIRLNKSVFKGCTKLSTITFGKNTIVADQLCFANCTALDSIVFNDCLFTIGGGAFSGCTSLKKVEGMPDSLADWVPDEKDSNVGIGFGNNMFANDTSLVSVQLPSTLTVIPEGCFAGCTAMTTVYNNSNIKGVGKNAFKGCSSLVEAAYPSLTTVDESGFEGCSSLKEIKYPLLKIAEKKAFAGCTTLKDVSIDADHLGDSVFEGCTGLKTGTVLSKEYGKSSFKDCSALESIKVNGAAMEMIPESTFSGCTALKKIDADFSKCSIVGKSAFSKCEALEKTALPNVRILEESAFADCTSLVSITSTGQPIAAEDYGAKCFQNCTSLSIEVDGEISTIGASAFQNSGVKKVNLDGMTGGTVVIGASAFSNCQALSEAKISSSKADKFSIGSSVFSGSPVLTKVSYDGPTITSGMFKDCTGLQYVDTNADSLLANGFSGCTSLEAVYDINHSANQIFKDMGTQAFMNCESLTSPSCNENTVFDGKQQYAGCTSLKTIRTEVLTPGMFSGCTALETVDISAQEAIPDNCFEKCTSLTAFDLSKVITVGKSAFAGSGIQSVSTVSAQSIGNAAFNKCTDLKEIDINVTKIDASAFYGCSFMEKAVICTETIGNNAFYECASLKEVTLQSNEAHTLTTIGTSAFQACDILYEIIIPGSPEIKDKALGYLSKGTNTNFVLVGDPGSSVEAYATKSKIEFADVAAFDLEARKSTRHTPGDVDGNSVISVVDAVKLKNWILGRKVAGTYSENMDVNQDGVVDIFDLGTLKSKLHK